MPQLSLDFPPPVNWPDFERLTLALCKAEWGDTEAYTLGRLGQKQFGVDVVGWDYRNHPKSRVGVECKRRSQSDESGQILAGGLVNIEDINNSLRASEELSLSLSLFVIATTAKQDTIFQQEIDTLSESRHRDGLCDVKVWFWEWFQEKLNRHFEVAGTYYPAILLANKMHDMDRNIAHVLRSGFDRPFMRTKFSAENNIGDIISAIVSLQQMLATGKLKDADGHTIYSVPIPRTMRTEQDRSCINDLYNRLQELRDDVTVCLREGTVSQAAGGWVLVADYRISNRLDEHRAKILVKLNELLSRHGIDALTSPLLM